MTAVHRQLGLTDDEFERIRGILGRDPNRAELAMYSVMWSEHCSYKSSRIHLSKLPTEGARVVVGPGEGAGVIDVDGVGVAIRLESHNHPSFVEPVQGAATGIGGIVRDVLSMGARPVALLDPLRFGPLPSEGRVDHATGQRNRFLVEGVVSGISSYGNCLGIPTVGGETAFEDCYSGNPLVNVMCIGVVPLGSIAKGEATGVGNAVLLLGSKTGRDGIGGVSVLASATFDEGAADKRPSVQVGDPFTEKLLIEACLEMMEAGLVVGIQDLGGAGLCCAASETAAKAGTGMRIDLEKVHLREPNMEPFEVLTSESQERMLVIAEPSDVEKCLAICEKWGLAAGVIGQVTDSGRLTVFDQGDVVADVPAASLGDGPVYDRPTERPKRLENTPPNDSALNDAQPPTDLQKALLEIVGSPNISSKRWVWEQYDHQVMLGTVAKPGRDAAVIRIPGASSRLAVTTDSSERFCYLDPHLGAQHSVAEAFRNLCAMGAEPVAVTNCLNFGSPERKDVMWEFVQVVEGLGVACAALGTPVTGGNVSFYNETRGAAIYPTPVIGMVGVIGETVKVPGSAKGPVVSEDDAVYLVGRTLPELGGSEYARTILGKIAGPVPSLDLALESSAGRLVRVAIAGEMLTSAHDCSQGGLGVALAELCCWSSMGATIRPEPGLAPHAWLFSETASRYLVTCPPAASASFEEAAAREGVQVALLGRTGGPNLQIEGILEVAVEELAARYRDSFAEAMGYQVSVL